MMPGRRAGGVAVCQCVAVPAGAIRMAALDSLGQPLSLRVAAGDPRRGWRAVYAARIDVTGVLPG